MKFHATAGDLQRALSVCALLLGDKRIKSIRSPGMAHVRADADGVAISVNVLDHAFTGYLIAEVEAPGEIAVDGARLADLVASNRPGPSRRPSPRSWPLLHVSA
jgi:hypothetical protein